MLSHHRRTHPLVSVILVVVAVYTVLSGAVAMTGDSTCANGWESAWRVFPPGWECQRVGP